MLAAEVIPRRCTATLKKSVGMARNATSTTTNTLWILTECLSSPLINHAVLPGTHSRLFQSYPYVRNVLAIHPLAMSYASSVVVPFRIS